MSTYSERYSASLPQLLKEEFSFSLDLKKLLITRCSWAAGVQRQAEVHAQKLASRDESPAAGGQVVKQVSPSESDSAALGSHRPPTAQLGHGSSGASTPIASPADRIGAHHEDPPSPRPLHSPVVASKLPEEDPPQPNPADYYGRPPLASPPGHSPVRAVLAVGPPEPEDPPFLPPPPAAAAASSKIPICAVNIKSSPRACQIADPHAGALSGSEVK